MHYTVAVRELCAFAAKQGDLDHRFTPSPTSEEGVAGHKVVASRRGSGYRAEVSVSGVFETLVVRGRADGFDAAAARVEEVKTFRGDLSLLPANQRALHRAQAMVYGALLCAEHGLPQLTVRLVYYDVDSGEETPLDEECSAEQLAEFFAEQCRRFLGWAQAELAHREARDAALRALAFVHPVFRSGQRELAEQCFVAARRGRALLAQAGTGLGKTLATLFATLKALPEARGDKLWFLTAKSSGHQAPLEALEQLAGRVVPLRVLELTARSKACVHPDKACHGESCPLARGFYDRLPAARQAAVGHVRLDSDTLRQLGQEHTVCPYYLAQEMARWSDVVVADYNYLFDVSALLHGLTLVNGWRVSLLVDEAHNLIDRGRAMYTATLWRDSLRLASAAAPASVLKPLRRLARLWSKLLPPPGTTYLASDELPDGLLKAAGQVCDAVGETLVQGASAVGPAVLELYFDLLLLRRLAESFSSHSIFDITTQGRGRSQLCLRNVVPASFLKPRFDAMASVVCFSATLQPHHFYADMLGLPPDTAWLDVGSPFEASQLDVQVVSHIPMRFAQRAGSVAPIAELIARQFRQRPGNYLAFFSSFDYLEQVALQLAEHGPDVPVWCQRRSMSEAERVAFLARFEPHSAGVALAVLGGSFAEGIDLPGQRLIGAFVATLGLPQVNAVNEQFRRVVDATRGAGFEYTYLYPGLRKVVQAAGRVIRTTSDRGTLYLIDERFARAAVRELLPAWWSPRPLSAGAEPRAQVLDDNRHALLTTGGGTRAAC